MFLNGREISLSKRPYIIAELSANHNGSLDIAKETIRSAKECGADAIKIQTYCADSMTIDCDNDDFLIKKGLWQGHNLYDLYKKAGTPYEWHGELFKYARKLGITIFSTPFDEKACDLLDKLGTPAYKIASFEMTDLPLIAYVAKKGKPMLISTGMSNFEEINEALHTAKTNGCKDILLFHCISSYPTPTKEANIKSIEFLRNEFGVEVGLSDHTMDNTAALAAISLGAVAIEKHFILNKKQETPDSEFSIEPQQLRELIKVSNACWQSLGSKSLKRSSFEIENKIFRRSLYFVKDLKAGEIITSDHIKRIRPGYGLAPKYIDKFLNKRSKIDVKRGDRVSWDVIDI
mgnify:CR=1 FL=1